MNSDKLMLRTPEGVLFSLRLASPITRLLAALVDMACVSVLTTVVSTLVKILALFSRDLAGAIWILAAFIIATAYPMLTEWLWRGQTLGKRLFRLRVMDVDGLNLHVSQVVLRNLLRAIDMLPVFYLVGGAAAMLTRHVQRRSAEFVIVRCRYR